MPKDCDFVTLSLPGYLDEEEVRREYAAEQLRDSDAHWVGASGGLAMCRGLTFFPHLATRLFDNADSATSYLQMYMKKWGPAGVVRHRNLEGNEMWLIGGWCAK